MFSHFTSSSTKSSSLKNSLPLLVFIHGFLGSKESFRRFPLDLNEYVKAEGGIGTRSFFSKSASPSTFDIETYGYSTTGSNEERVNELILWLRNRCAASPPAYVVLLAHSMGGLMASDAATQILTESASTGAKSIDIRAVLTFDSPFFGLHPRVLTKSGVDRVQKTVEQFSGIFGSLATVAASAKAASSASSRASSAAASRAGSAASSSAKSSSTSLWAGVAAVATIAAAGYAASQHPTVQTHIQRTTESISKHVEFLGPLWRVDNQELRITKLKSFGGKVVFKCFYMQIPPKTSADPPSTFISLPTHLGADTQALFIPIKVPVEAVSKIATDEIDAHVNMFDALMGSAYFDMMSKVLDILKALERQR
ncbi:hypothetical protein BC829DRAFT_171254 [Chytridium lagenaria]|nr:hypothetical protein BC829DRAFT_171254 [Chytridium lagenaria]